MRYQDRVRLLAQFELSNAALFLLFTVDEKGEVHIRLGLPTETPEAPDPIPRPNAAGEPSF
jgi:hypothetical protein